MKKTSVASFDSSDQALQIDLSDSIPQINLDALQAFFHQTGDVHHPSPAPSHVQFRSVDGSDNNQIHASFNQTGSDFTRIGSANFARWRGYDGLRSESANDQQRGCGREWGSPEPGGPVGNDVRMGAVHRSRS